MNKIFPTYFWLSPEGEILDIDLMYHEQYIRKKGYEDKQSAYNHGWYRGVKHGYYKKIYLEGTISQLNKKQKKYSGRLFF